MKAIADVVPSVRSFAGRGNMDWESNGEPAHVKGAAHMSKHLNTRNAHLDARESRLGSHWDPDL